jgi:hypothetical protein
MVLLMLEKAVLVEVGLSLMVFYILSAREGDV